MSKIIGVTGPSGSGKSLACRYFKELGCAVVDCDLIARRATRKNSPCLLKLQQAFGDEILCRDGRLNRRKLSAEAFSSKEKTALLNQITHPHILADIQRKIDALQKQGRTIVIDAPLLFTGGLDKQCDMIVAIVAGEDLRKERLRQRDKLSEERLEGRIKAYREPIDRPDVMVYCNDSNAEDLYRFVTQILKTITADSQQ